MAINFPSTPNNGDEYIDAGSGTEWVYNSTDKSWTMTGAGSSSPFNFRGGYDFTTANTIGAIESGDLFIHEGSDGTVGSGYVGLSGQITAGTLVLWDGDEFIKLSSSVPGYPDIDDPNYQNGTLDERYLGLAADAGAQTVQSTGTTTFNGLVEAGKGVKVTGGDTSVNDGLVRYGNGSLGLVSDSIDSIRISQEAGKEGYIGFYTSTPAFPLTFRLDFDDTAERYCDFTPTHQGTATNAYNVTSSWVQDAGSDIDNAIIYNAISGDVDGTTENLTGFRVNRTLGQASTVSSKGFNSDLNTESGVDNYNFYSEGNAPNYFRGDVLCGNTTSAPHAFIHASGAIESLCPGLVDGTYAGFRAFSADSTQVTDANKALAVFNKGTVDSTFSISYLGNTTRATGTGVYELTDRRVLSSLTSISDATSKVKQLSPGVEGFIADEVQSVVSNAVLGNQDATEEIGTLADYDGTVLGTAVIEPDDLTYTEDVEVDGVSTATVRTRTWTPSGTRPVYQGVDQTKLIPLLTKALQEALERIEALEAAATA